MNPFPVISIVTPSFNQAAYLEECIESVLSQGYPHLEYVIMDGGSTDGSIDIIKKYEKQLTYWQSCPDGGQYRAITEGFRHTTGEVMAWLNSDDKYHPLAFAKVASVFGDNPQMCWLTGRKSFWDASGNLSKIEQGLGIFTRHKFLAGDFDKPYIQQESTFWRRSLWNDAGACLSNDAVLAGDLELWLRFFRYAQLYTVDTLLGGYRFHDDQRGISQAAQYYQECLEIVAAENERLHAFPVLPYNPVKTHAIDRNQLVNRLGMHRYPNLTTCWSEYTEDLMALIAELIEEGCLHHFPFWQREIGLFGLLKPRAVWLLGRGLSALGHDWERLEQLCSSAGLHERSGNVREATVLFHEAYQKDIYYAVSAAGLLRCLLLDERLQEGLSFLPDILSRHAHSAEVVSAAVKLLDRCGAFEQATGVCNEFVSVNPHDNVMQHLLAARNSKGT